MTKQIYTIWNGTNLDASQLPYELLKKTALNIDKETKGKIEVNLNVKIIELRQLSMIGFYLVCPKLDNYIYGLLDVHHSTFAPYPATIFWNDEIHVTKNVEEFKAKLQIIFSHDFTLNVIDRLNQKSILAEEIVVI